VGVCSVRANSTSVAVGRKKKVCLEYRIGKLHAVAATVGKYAVTPADPAAKVGMMIAVTVKRGISVMLTGLRLALRENIAPVARNCAQFVLLATTAWRPPQIAA
jgi:hypothetical protein